MSVSECPPSIAIGELTLGVLADEDAPAIIEHLLRCRRCTAEWDAFRGFLAEADMPQTCARLR